MKWIIYVVIIGLLIVVNQTLFALFEFNGFVPNLMLLLVFAMIVSFETFDFIFFAVLGGVWMDVFTGLPIGSYTLGLLLLGFVTVWVINSWLLSNKNWRHFLGTIVIGSALMHVWLWFYSTLIFSVGWHPVSIDTSIMLRTLVPVLVANLVLAYPVFIFIEYIAGLLNRMQRRKILT